MRADLDEALVRDFPHLYSARHTNKPGSCMSSGFCCGNGWEPLIRRCSEKIEREIRSLPEDLRTEFYAVQLKEKYGTLRLYLSRFNEQMEEAVSIAETESSVTCEVCGDPGKLRVNGWLRTLCSKDNKSKSSNR